MSMWKNLTTPDLHKPQARPPKPPNLSGLDLSFSQLTPQVRQLTIEAPSFEYGDKEHSLGSRRSPLHKQGSISRISMGCRKQELILMQIEENEKLRLHLYRAQRTLDDLATICHSMNSKVNKLVELKDIQHEGAADRNPKEGRCNGAITKRYEPILVSQDEKQSVWRKCYYQLVNSVAKYTDDISILIAQYRAAQTKKQQYRKSSAAAKKNEKNLIKILQQSNIKLEQTEHLIQKSMDDIKDRDLKLQQYQLQNKTLKLQIVDLREQVENLKRENKLKGRDTLSYKQVAKTLKAELAQLQIHGREEQLEKQKVQIEVSTLKQNESMLRQRIKLLEEELAEVKKFNENLMEEYRQLARKQEGSEYRSMEKHHTVALQGERLAESEKMVEKLKAQALKIKEMHSEEISKLKKMNSALLTQKQETDSKVAEIDRQMNGMLEELELKLNQKDQLLLQMEERNGQLLEELEEARQDLLAILEELRQKQIQVDKYESKKLAKQAKRRKNAKNSTEDILKCLASHNQNPELAEIPCFNNSPAALGINWKKISPANQFQYDKDENQVSWNHVPSHQPHKQLIIQDCSPIGHSFRTSCNQLKENSLSSQQSSEHTKQKFSLQAFQNRIIMEENARLLLKLHKNKVR